jgi:hypothetical protein
MTRLCPFRLLHGLPRRRSRFRATKLAVASLLAITLTLTGCASKGSRYSATFDITGSMNVSGTIGVSCNGNGIPAGYGVGTSAYAVWEMTGPTVLSGGPRVFLDIAIEDNGPLVEGVTPSIETQAIGPQTPSYVSWRTNGTGFAAGGLESDPQASGTITMRDGGSTGTFSATVQGSAITGEWTC